MKPLLDNLLPLSIAGLLGVTGFGMIIAGMDTESRARSALAQQVEKNKLDVYLSGELVITSTAKAEQRYDGGCYVVDLQLSRDLKFPGLEPNDFVCDRSGRTGVLNGDRQVTDIARTTNDAVIQRRLSQL